MQDSLLTANTASADGGAIYAANASLRIENSALSDNVSGDEGGAVQQTHGQLDVVDSVLEGNPAHNGGAITSGATLATFDGSTLPRNAASPHGGAIYGLTLGTALFLADTELTANTGTDGGGVIWAGGVVDVATATFTDN